MRISDKPVAARLADLGVELRAGVSLQELTSLGIGGTTDLLLIRRYEALPEVIRELKNEGIPYKFLGGGTNVLVADGELPWVMLHLPACQTGRARRRQCGYSLMPPPISAAPSLSARKIIWAAWKASSAFQAASAARCA